MSKLRLHLDSLNVESFAVGGTGPFGGTVVGNNSPEPTSPEYWTCAVNCPGEPTAFGETCGDSCDAACMTAGYDCPTPLCSMACFDATFMCETAFCSLPYC